MSEAATDGLATKDDLARLEAATKSDIAELKADLYRAMWIFGGGIVTINLTAIGAATGLIIAFG